MNRAMRTLKPLLRLFRFAPVLLLMAHACTHRVDGVVIISVDLQKTIELDINTLPNVQTIVFGQTDVLLTGRGTVWLDSDIILIQQRDSVMAFDPQGKYLFTLARKGRGPGEYTNIESLFIYEGLIYIQNKFLMQVYDQKGSFLRAHTLTQTPQEAAPRQVYPAGNHHFIARGDYGKQMEYAIGVLNTDFGFVQPVIGKSNISEISTTEHFSPYGDELLFWEVFCDTIFSIKNLTNIYPKYYVDFGANSVPKSVYKKGTWAIMEFLNEEVNSGRYAGFLHNILEGQHYLTAFFAFHYEKSDLLVYDKVKKRTQNYALFDSDDDPDDFSLRTVVHTQGDKLMFYGGKGEEVMIRIIDVGDLP